MKKLPLQKFLLIVLLSTVSASAVCQSRLREECGFKITPEAALKYDRALQTAVARTAARTAIVYHVRVFIHDYISSTGVDSAWSKAEVLNEFNVAAGLFRPYNICLVLAGVDYPRNTNYKDSFNTANIGNLQTSSLINHTASIDVSLHRTLYDNGYGYLNGIAYDIIGKWMSLSRGAINNRSFAHELGHCLGLLHTFETYYGLECPDGSNNTTAGDKITDTRATPVADSALTANTSAACVYSGYMTINCNGGTKVYNPEIINMMCYGRRTCRNVFTDEQVALMTSNLDDYPVLQHTWFENINAITLAPPAGYVINNYSDTLVVGSPVQIGNNNSVLNYFLGGQGVQRIVSPSYISIKPGVQILPTSGNNYRGSVLLTIAAICANAGSTFSAPAANSNLEE